MATDFETVIVGAGVIGLAIARALCLRGHNVAVIERHPQAGTEVSARNSGVIHAGLYYPTGSLRAQLSVKGLQALYHFAKESGVKTHQSGKLIVATQDHDVDRLNALKYNAEKNGVTGLEILSQSEATKIEPELACAQALYSPRTGVIDSHGLVTALEGHIGAHSGDVIANTCIEDVQPSPSGGYHLTTSDGNKLTCKSVILSAGLGTHALADKLFERKCAQGRHSYTPPKLFLAKGHYYALTTTCPFSHLIYPLPTEAWLGVHLTRGISGHTKFGPDIEWVDHVSYAFDHQGGQRQARFEKSIRKFWPNLPDNALAPDDTGIRPKIYSANETPADFAIHGKSQHGLDNLICLFGIESPGLTSSLAIGDYVADLL